ncbi:MAG: fructosamine kinase family protein [Nitrosomonas sp.]|nr:fructosamine kinase family protein [Nitrosomonas sp.]
MLHVPDQSVSSTPWLGITAKIAATVDDPAFAPEHVIPIGGGCINQTYCLEGRGQRFFIKLNHARYLPMFASESSGLQEIGQSTTLRVPRPICHGIEQDFAWLALEFIPLQNRGNQSELGMMLASMHHHTTDRFGWETDNTIGITLQKNTLTTDWISFWQQHRLGFQLRLARKNGYAGRLQQLGERLMDNLAYFFDDLPAASLLHGDLWSGNYAFTSTGQPVVFDPAVYYGDREADMAMTELFGGFSADFYAAYQSAWPLDDGYRTRKQLYNLYHILNHLNLFGKHYLHQAETTMEKLLAEIH